MSRTYDLNGLLSKTKLVNREAKTLTVAGNECLLCKKSSANKLGLCSETCVVNAQKKAPCILPVPEEHNIFKSGMKYINISPVFIYNTSKCENSSPPPGDIPCLNSLPFDSSIK